MHRKMDSVPTGVSRKLDPKFKGLFKFKKSLPNDWYVIEDLRGTGRVITVATVDNLKPCITMNEGLDQPFL